MRNMPRAARRAVRSAVLRVPGNGVELGSTMKTLPLLLAAAALLTSPLQAAPAPAAPTALATAEVVKDVSPEEAAKLLQNNPKIVVLDVRTPEEFAAGHIAGAKNVDFKAADFAAQVAALDKGQTYLVHCAAGGRSGKTLDLMKGHHFNAIYHLKEGFKAWEKAGKPVQK